MVCMCYATRLRTTCSFMRTAFVIDFIIPRVWLLSDGLNMFWFSSNQCQQFGNALSFSLAELKSRSWDARAFCNVLPGSKRVDDNLRHEYESEGRWCNSRCRTTELKGAAVLFSNSLRLEIWEGGRPCSDAALFWKGRVMQEMLPWRPQRVKSATIARFGW